MTIYTRTGDQGETDLLHGGRVPKDAVRLEESGLTILGRGASTDIIEASAKAYLNAINKLMQARRTRRKGK